MNELLPELLIVLAMVAVTVVVHLLGLMLLMRMTQCHLEHLRTRWLALDRMLVPLGMAIGLFLLHGVEVFGYAAAYQAGHATRNWEQALYLSAGAYATAGWPGVNVPHGWRLIAAFESLNGILLLGWSTAFLFQTLHRILQTEENHPLPEGAIAEEPVEEPPPPAEAKPSPRPRRSGKGAP